MTIDYSIFDQILKKWVTYIIFYPQVIFQIKLIPELLLGQFLKWVEKLIKDLWKHGVSLPQAKLYFFTYFSPLNWTDSHMLFYCSSALALQCNTFFVLRTPGHLETNDVTGVPLVRMWKIAFDDSFTDCAACTKG